MLYKSHYKKSTIIWIILYWRVFNSVPYPAFRVLPCKLSEVVIQPNNVHEKQNTVRKTLRRYWANSWVFICYLSPSTFQFFATYGMNSYAFSSQALTDISSYRILRKFTNMKWTCSKLSFQRVNENSCFTSCISLMIKWSCAFVKTFDSPSSV